MGEQEATRQIRAMEPAEGPQGRHVLVPEGTAGQQEPLPLKTGPNAIGRSSEADIVVEDEGGSRWHAEVRVDPDGLAYVRDLGSTNGTMVNGESLSGDEVRPLRPGDVIQIGLQTELLYTVLED